MRRSTPPRKSLVVDAVAASIPTPTSRVSTWARIRRGRSWESLAGRELPRALAVYGLILGAALVVGLTSGHLTLGIHGFGLVILGQSAWIIWTAVALWRVATTTASPGT